MTAACIKDFYFHSASFFVFYGRQDTKVFAFPVLNL